VCARGRVNEFTPNENLNAATAARWRNVTPNSAVLIDSAAQNEKERERDSKRVFTCFEGGVEAQVSALGFARVSRRPHHDAAHVAQAALVLAVVAVCRHTGTRKKLAAWYRINSLKRKRARGSAQTKLLPSQALAQRLRI
jgi:hypothetical protein